MKIENRQRTRHTKIHSGDRAIFFLNRGTLAFNRPGKTPNSKRRVLRWDDMDDQKLFSASLNPHQNRSQAFTLIKLICQTHNFSFRFEKDEHTNGEPKIIFEII